MDIHRRSEQLAVLGEAETAVAVNTQQQQLAYGIDQHDKKQQNQRPPEQELPWPGAGCAGWERDLAHALLMITAGSQLRRLSATAAIVLHRLCNGREAKQSGRSRQLGRGPRRPRLCRPWSDCR